jgi:D-erythro-7,8-dihydroneopterin triphosphate epimerase
MAHALINDGRNAVDENDDTLANLDADNAGMDMPCLRVTTSVINVRNLRLRTFIGFNPEERAKKQDVVINIEIAYRIGVGAFRDDVDDALNYRNITKNVIEHVEGGQFLLLERLVFEVLAMCSDDPRVNRTRVTIDKPHALRFADSVSLTMEHQADEYDSEEDK